MLSRAGRSTVVFSTTTVKLKMEVAGGTPPSVAEMDKLYTGCEKPAFVQRQLHQQQQQQQHQHQRQHGFSLGLVDTTSQKFVRFDRSVNVSSRFPRTRLKVQFTTNGQLGSIGVGSV